MLFNPTELKTETRTDGAMGIDNEGVSLFTLGLSLKHLDSHIGVLERNRCIHYMTKGHWSSHQLVKYLVAQTGPADLYMTSWSCTEEPLRMLLDLKMRGAIRKCTAIFSDRMIERTPKVYDLARNLFDEMALKRLHAKVNILVNDEWGVTNLGSANFSNNPRLETGIIDTNRDIANAHIGWIREELST